MSIQNQLLYDGVDNVCRGCLGKKGEMRPLFGSCLDSMLMNVAEIQIQAGDGLPELMCVQCVLQVSRAFTFKQQCQRSDAALRMYIRSFNEAIVSESTDSDVQTQPLEVQFEDPNNGEKCVLIVQHMSMIDGNNQNIEMLDGNNQAIEIIDRTNQTIEMLNGNNQTIEMLDVNSQTIKLLDESHQTIEILEGSNQGIEMPDENHIIGNVILEENVNTDSQQSEELSNIKFEDTDDVKIEVVASFPIVNNIDNIHSEEITEKFETYSDDGNDPSFMVTVQENIFETTNEDLKPYCSECCTEFKTIDEVLQHQATQHNLPERPYQCEVCFKMFSETKILKRHMKIHSPNKPHVCPTCNMSFAESSNLTKHKKKHTGELRNIVGKPNLCSVCGKRFKWTSSLSKHMKHHTKHKILNCPYCPKYYVEARSLNIHIRSHTGEKPFVCEVCKKGFTQMGNLEKHMRVHTGEKPFLCPVCGKGFSQSGYVAIHVRTHTGERPYQCTDCGKGFAGSNTLAIHKRTHTGERPYPCKICGKAFARQETAVIHQRTHTGEKPHVCTICHRGFTSSGHLSGHMRSHTGVKPHECTVCKKRFAGGSSLKVHMKAHISSELLVYMCKLCTKTFQTQAALTEHELEHTLEKQTDINKFDINEAIIVNSDIIIGN